MYLKKQVNEDRPYGSAAVEQTIVTIDRYFVLGNGDLIEVKNSKIFRKYDLIKTKSSRYISGTISAPEKTIANTGVSLISTMNLSGSSFC